MLPPGSYVESTIVERDTADDYEEEEEEEEEEDDDDDDEDGVAPLKRREGKCTSSHFKGVSWHKVRRCRLSLSNQGLTLVHFSAQLEPCLTRKHPTHPKYPLTPPSHGLHNP